MTDAKKNHRELEEEIEALRRQLAGGASPVAGEPSLAGRVTRRDALKVWIAPVLVSVPLAARGTAKSRIESSDARPAGASPTAVPTPFAPTAERPPSKNPTPVAPTAETPPSMSPTPVAPTLVSSSRHLTEI